MLTTPPPIALPFELTALSHCTEAEMPAAFAAVGQLFADTTPSLESITWLRTLLEPDPDLPGHVQEALRDDNGFRTPFQAILPHLAPHYAHIHEVELELAARIVADPTGAPLHPRRGTVLFTVMITAVAGVVEAGGTAQARAYLDRLPPLEAAGILAGARTSLEQLEADLQAEDADVELRLAAGGLSPEEANAEHAKIAGCLAGHRADRARVRERAQTALASLRRAG